MSAFARPRAQGTGPRRAALHAEDGPISRERAGRFAGLPLPAWLVLLSVVPMLGGVARLLQLAGGDAPAPADLRFAVSPLPVVLHIAAATVYCLVGAFQFDRGMRSRWPALHRLLGRLVVACGVAVALSALWMTLASEIPTGLQGELLRLVRTAVAGGMLFSLVKGVVAIRAGEVGRHLAWMVRAYALAQGAGTQALLLLVPTLAFGEITGLVRDLAMTSAWLLNLWVVERVLVPRMHAPPEDVMDRALQVGRKEDRVAGADDRPGLPAVRRACSFAGSDRGDREPFDP
jgi:uncharacterized membrane protein